MEWVKALHVIFVIAWMAGIFYLPRLFVYHCRAEKGSDQSETFKIMEQKLLKVIMRPAMILSWVFGLWLVIGFNVIDFSQIWPWVKLVGVVAMTAFHMFLASTARAFAEDRNQRPEKFFRAINEIPTLLMVVIVIMVIVRPF